MHHGTYFAQTYYLVTPSPAQCASMEDDSGKECEGIMQFTGGSLIDEYWHVEQMRILSG